MAGLFNNNDAATVETSTETPVVITESSDSGLFSTSTASTPTESTRAPVIIQDDEGEGLFSGKDYDSVEGPSEAPVVLQDNDAQGVFGNGGAVNVVSGGTGGGDNITEIINNNNNVTNVDGDVSFLINDWDGGTGYLPNEVVHYETSGVPTTYRANNTISTSGTIDNPAVAEQGTVTVDTGAMVDMGDPGSPETVTLSIRAAVENPVLNEAGTLNISLPFADVVSNRGGSSSSLSFLLNNNANQFTIDRNTEVTIDISTIDTLVTSLNDFATGSLATTYLGTTITFTSSSVDPSNSSNVLLTFTTTASEQTPLVISSVGRVTLGSPTSYTLTETGGVATRPGSTGSSGITFVPEPINVLSINNGDTFSVNFATPTDTLNTRFLIQFTVSFGSRPSLTFVYPTDDSVVLDTTSRDTVIATFNELVGLTSRAHQFGEARLVSVEPNPLNETDIILNLEVVTSTILINPTPPLLQAQWQFTDNSPPVGSTFQLIDSFQQPSQLRIVTGVVDETLTLSPGLTTPATIAADIVTMFNANTNLRTIFNAATVNDMDQVVFDTIENGDIAAQISAIPNSGSLSSTSVFMNGVSGTFTAPVIRVVNPDSVTGFTDIALQSEDTPSEIASAIGLALDNNGQEVTVSNNIVSYTRDIAGVVQDITVNVQTQGSSNLVDSQFTVVITRQGAAATFLPNPIPSLDNRWDAIGNLGTSGGTGGSYVLPDNNVTNALITGNTLVLSREGVSDVNYTADVNVQSDWEETDTTSDAYIVNKPVIPTVNDSTVTFRINDADVGTLTTNQSGDTTVDFGTIQGGSGGTGNGFTLVDSIPTTGTLGDHIRTTSDLRGYVMGDNVYTQVDGQTSIQVTGSEQTDWADNGETPSEWQLIPTYFIGTGDYDG